MDDTSQSHRLKAADGASCGPVAVGSVTGNSREEVEDAILKAAQEDRENPQHFNDTSFRHQARAVERLGRKLFKRDGTPIDARRDIPRDMQITPSEFDRAPAVDNFFQTNQSEDVLLCLACSREAGKDPHTFAVHRRYYYDNNSAGVVKTSVPDGLEAYRVVKVVAVR